MECNLFSQELAVTGYISYYSSLNLDTSTSPVFAKFQKSPHEDFIHTYTNIHTYLCVCVCVCLFSLCRLQFLTFCKSRFHALECLDKIILLLEALIIVRLQNRILFLIHTPFVQNLSHIVISMGIVKYTPEEIMP